MANGFSAVVRQNWEKGLQAVLEKSLVSMDLGTMKIIPDGTVLNIPRLAFQSTQTYTKYTDLTFSDLTTASDTLTLNTNAVVTFSMDDLDEEDNYINITPQAIRQGGIKLKERLDGDFLNEVLNANLVYDNGGLRANTGTITPIALATGGSQNISLVFGNSRASLSNAGADISRLALVVDAFTMNTINTLGLETGFQVADEAFKNMIARGYQGRFLGMDTYVAGCLTASRVLDLATNPTAGDTVTINGQTFTFVAAIGTTAGNVLIGASADATRVSLAALLNAPGTTTATGVAVTDPAKFEGLVATDSPAGDTLTVVSKRGTLIASSVMTNASNDWAAETLNCGIMEKGAIYMALRDNLKVRDAREPKKLVTNYTVLTRYGIVTPSAGRERMVRIAIQSAAAEA
jgi:hypothetical protein